MGNHNTARCKLALVLNLHETFTFIFHPHSTTTTTTATTKTKTTNANTHLDSTGPSSADLCKHSVDRWPYRVSCSFNLCSLIKWWLPVSSSGSDLFRFCLSAPLFVGCLSTCSAASSSCSLALPTSPFEVAITTCSPSSISLRWPQIDLAAFSAACFKFDWARGERDREKG